MTNRHGDFIWYELMTRQPGVAKAFYENVVGWKIGEPLPGDVEYRPIAAGDEQVGGLLQLNDEMCQPGAGPAWIGYIGVDDVDATIEKLQRLGGEVLMPAHDIPGIGRLAMVTDREGAPFYLMRGASDETSTAFQVHDNGSGKIGHCGWNELTTTDQIGALNFYGELFGWTSTESMPMGEADEYRFIDHRGIRIGAVSPQLEAEARPVWTYYFYVPDIDASVTTIQSQNGKIVHGPHEVPGGDHIIIGRDPEETMFALFGPRRTNQN